MTGTAQTAAPEIVPMHHGCELHDALWRDVQTYSAVPQAAALARRHVAGCLRERGFSRSFTERAVLVVSELVANAVRASQALAPVIGPVHVVLAPYQRSVLLIVADASPRLPLRRECGADSESCRGLFLVNAMSDRWGWHPVTDWPGACKCVWAEWRTRAR
jgi:anti-sigma regulatory factor (Ser/Thr protein kinase)